MGLLWTIVIGFIVGALAKLIMPGKDPGGIIITILLGIGGAVVASYLGQMAGLYAQGQAAGFIGSVVGAMILLGLYRLIKGKRA
ncbi:MAG: GlsB/YeaQ/YmgE family stress response membrane protein [Acidobacteria bacterium]|nr:GlsB/YeaQ/YmgE family stress response membrane protein [Acidobacteriota bacterium]